MFAFVTFSPVPSLLIASVCLSLTLGSLARYFSVQAEVISSNRLHGDVSLRRLMK